ncbi:MAG TPA: group I intron-associated PD-(D/E)XK endonuclease [Capillimicrobium sp.]
MRHPRPAALLARYTSAVADLKRRGDLAELRVAADVLARGHRVAIPFGEDCPYDLVVDRAGRLERVQVKHTRSDGSVVVVRCRTQSLTNGRVRATTKYTAASIDWIAVYDATTDRCFYVPAAELGERGRAELRLRIAPARNGQRSRVRLAADYLFF